MNVHPGSGIVASSFLFTCSLSRAVTTAPQPATPLMYHGFEHPYSSTTSFLVTFPDMTSASHAHRILDSQKEVWTGHIINEPAWPSKKGSEDKVVRPRLPNILHGKAKSIFHNKVQRDPTKWSAQILTSQFLLENFFPHIDRSTDRPVTMEALEDMTAEGEGPTTDTSTNATQEEDSRRKTRYMTHEEKHREAAQYVKACADAKIGQFGNAQQLAESGRAGEPAMSGRQVHLSGMPEWIRERTWTDKLLTGFKLAERDAVFHLPK